MSPAGSKLELVATVFDKKIVVVELVILIESVWVVISDCVDELTYMFSCSESFKLLSDPLTVELNLAELKYKIIIIKPI